MNKLKFNKRTKVVIVILALNIALLLASSSTTFVLAKQKGACEMYELPYVLLSQQHVVVMIIYAFLVGRMLAIYWKLTLVQDVEAAARFKARCARRSATGQNVIIFIYFSVYTSFLWTFYFVWEYAEPKGSLDLHEQFIYGSLLVPKFLFELSILFAFLAMYRTFNQWSRSYQEHEDTNSNFVCITKTLGVVMATLFLINTFLFNVVTPLMYHFSLEEKNEDTKTWYQYFLV